MAMVNVTVTKGCFFSGGGFKHFQDEYYSLANSSHQAQCIRVNRFNKQNRFCLS